MILHTIQAMTGPVPAAPASQHLVDPDRTPGALGTLTVQVLPGGGALAVGPAPVESAVVLLAGQAGTLPGTPTGYGAGSAALRVGSAVFVPAGGCQTLVSHGSTPAVLLTIRSGAADAATTPRPRGSWGRARLRQNPAPAALAEGEGYELLGTTGGFSDMDVRWLVSTQTTGAASITVATSTFRSSGSHDLHRHPHADEFFLVVEGAGEHLTATGAVRLGVGDLAYVPAGEWHGFRTDPAVVTRTIYGYLGAGSLDAAGYHLRDTTCETELTP